MDQGTFQWRYFPVSLVIGVLYTSRQDRRAAPSIQLTRKIIRTKETRVVRACANVDANAFLHLSCRRSGSGNFVLGIFGIIEAPWTLHLSRSHARLKLYY